MHPSFLDTHNHPALILIGLALFPRITLLFMGGPFTILHWLGWGLVPHFMVAVLATISYGESDPVLVVFAWLFALSGTSAEAKTVKSRRRETD